MIEKIVRGALPAVMVGRMLIQQSAHNFGFYLPQLITRVSGSRIYYRDSAVEIGQWMNSEKYHATLRDGYVCDKPVEAEMLRELGNEFHAKSRELDAEFAQRLASLMEISAAGPISECAPRELQGRINQTAVGEGWAMFECGDGHICIDSDAESNAFSSGVAAYDYVEARAKAGSALHQAAIDLHRATVRNEQSEE